MIQDVIAQLVEKRDLSREQAAEAMKILMSTLEVPESCALPRPRDSVASRTASPPGGLKARALPCQSGLACP